MNAAFKRDPDREERTTMPLNDNGDLREQVAGLRSDVRHIQGDITDIKAELRATNQRIDGTNQRIDSVNESLTKRIDSLSQSLNAAKIWALILGGSAYGSLLLVMAKGFKWL
jgi:peptidoglycan hydrolase CwlO-like protein